MCHRLCANVSFYVAGPMVYGICFCPVSKKEELKDLKVAGNPVLMATEKDVAVDHILMLDSQRSHFFPHCD